MITAEEAADSKAIAGIGGPGRWLIVTYEPTALFSLKMSTATSSVGKTLVVPTPYAYKTALVDAACRSGREAQAEQFVRELRSGDVRIGPPERATVTHTIVKIRQEPKDRKTEAAYIPAVAYREYVHYRGQLRFAVDLTTISDSAVELMAQLAPAVNYIGKRGGFLQYIGMERLSDLGSGFTHPLDIPEMVIPAMLHIGVLDDYGPEMTMEALNSFGARKIRRDRDRMFVRTAVPLGVVRVGPGFTEYTRGAEP